MSDSLADIVVELVAKHAGRSRCHRNQTEPGYGDLPRCSNKCERESGAEAATSHSNPVHQIAMCLDARSKNRPFRNNHRSVPAF